MQLLNLFHNNMVVDLLFNRMIVLDSLPKNPKSIEFPMDKLIILNLILNLILNVSIVSYVLFRIFSSFKDKQIPDNTLSIPSVKTSQGLINNTKCIQTTPKVSETAKGFSGDSKISSPRSVKNVNINQFYNQTDISLVGISKSTGLMSNMYSLIDEPHNNASNYSDKSMREKILSEMNVSKSMQCLLLQNKKSSKPNRRTIL
ncbi:uncharacterized protein LOC103512258 isoform X2 [Diaphorina citri]|uniref:Uncharacterized protein LOC103512258 isoform X1 n=1 Tax=Diaphorina citri TaxID=121845 RepID=A0A1S3D652_DIACI|nr:uncharacterized protein LOC103512258 isoform X1 [Diaphorina citri]XP_026681584.1 uncharacterized protein LOC103512258 isoform X2 [Diaphorina citri]